MDLIRTLRALPPVSRLRTAIAATLIVVGSFTPAARAMEKAAPVGLAQPIDAQRLSEAAPKADSLQRPNLAGKWVNSAVDSSSRRFAEGFSEITAAAVSPLLVVSSIGALRYFRTPASERENLPWFCDPVAWSLGLGLLSLCLLKDIFGTVLPTPLKKPMDMLELFENKLSGLIANTLFVPVVVSQMMATWGNPSTLASPPPEVYWAQAIPAEWLHADLRWLLVASAMFCFFSVWVAAHMINVLIALCPIGAIDALLKGCKSTLLALILGASAIHPFVGAAFCGILLLIALSVMGYAFRFAIFGMFMALDVLLFWSPKRGSDTLEARAFAGAGTRGAPVRSYGRVRMCAEGRLFFEYRPWMILPRRSVELPQGRLHLRKGLLMVSLLLENEEPASPSTADKPLPVLEFLPRYRRHVEVLADRYRIAEVRDGAFVGGLKALWQWVAETARPQRFLRKA